MKRVLPVFAVVLALAACKKPDSSAATSSDRETAAADASSQAGAEPNAASAATGDVPAAVAPVPVRPASPPPPQLAMAYRLGMVLAADQVRPLMESHQEACELAGPEQCQVLGAHADAKGRDKVSAELTLRATPAWMRLFRHRAELDVKDLDGRILDAATEGEDLSRPIVDAQADQRAREAEKARLAELMRRHNRHLDQNLQVEQEITRVQGDMDRSASELAAMRGRVAMATMTVSYQSNAMVASDGVAAPLAQAGKGFVGNFVAVLAFLLTLASYLLPLALVGAPVAWWLMRSSRRPARPTPPAAP